MNQMIINRRSAKGIFLIFVLLLVPVFGGALVWAVSEDVQAPPEATTEEKVPSPSTVGDVMGEWEVTMEFDGRKSYAMLSISKKEDGTLAGKWGRDELSDVKFEDGKLTFVRKVGPPDRQFTMNYEATLKDDKLMLTMTNDWGEFPAVGARPKPMCPVLGQWDVNFDVGDREVNARLVISEKPDGTLEGKWTKEEGEHVISDVKFKDGKLTFTRSSKVNDFEFETYFEGAVKGHELTGTFKNEMGQWQVEGKRFGTELIGEWELTTTSEWGTHTSIMRIFPDLNGRYESFGGEIPMNDLKLEGDQVTFSVVAGWGDRTFQLDFKGKLDGKTLKGQMTSDMGTSDVTGKKL